MEKNRKQNLCHLVHQETGFQGKFDLGWLNHKGSSHQKTVSMGAKECSSSGGLYWHLRIKREKERSSRICYYLQEKIKLTF